MNQGINKIHTIEYSRSIFENPVYLGISDSRIFTKALFRTNIINRNNEHLLIKTKPRIMNNLWDFIKKRPKWNGIPFILTFEWR